MGNYNMRSKLAHEWGVVKFLGEKGILETGRRGVINNVLVEFLTELELPIVVYNPKYQGHYDALNRNCTTVQEHWDQFHTWVNNRKKNESITN